MRKPSDFDLSAKIGKYSLVIAATKRAKQLSDGSKPLVSTDSSNQVAVALEEIALGKVRVIQGKAMEDED